MVKRVLEEIPNVEVWEGNYGHFDLLRFWCPAFTRQQPIDEVRAELEKAKTAISHHPDGRLSVIAHSYGTYVITKILASKLDLHLHRLVLCGSIVKRTYPWHTLGNRIAPNPLRAGKKNIINDYGLRDFYPVFAKCLSWGYGDTGRHKFGKAEVFDRGHNLDHSGFFTQKDPNGRLEKGELFVRTFWKPWFETGEIVASPDDKHGDSPFWLSALSFLPVKSIVCVLIVVWICGQVVRSDPSHIQVPAPGQNVAPIAIEAVNNLAAEQELHSINDESRPTIVLPPLNFPSPEIAGVTPLTDEERSSEKFANARVVIRNETNKSLKLAFAYRPYQGRNPHIGASPYVQRESPEVSPGVTIEHREDNFGGPVHVSIFADGKWNATNEWLDLQVVPRRTLVVTEEGGVFNCRVEFEDDAE